MPETTPLIKAALNLRVGVGFDVYDEISIYTISFPNAPNPNAHFCPVLSFIEIPPKNNPLYLILV